MKVIIFLLILFNSFYANSQQIIRRLDPELSNGYQTSGLLPGGGKRIIISTTTSQKKPLDLSYGLDWTETKGEIEVWQANPSPFGYGLPYSAYDIASINFPSGDMILQSNNRDCNHNWYSDMMMVSSDRSITWRLGRYQADYEVISNSPGMVDRNTVAFISPQFDTVYVDLDGNEKTITGIPIIYTHMLIHPNRYFGFSAGRWVALDTNFQEINSIPIDNVGWAGDLGG